MRDIKFRLWCGDKKEMISVESLKIFDNGDIVANVWREDGDGVHIVTKTSGDILLNVWREDGDGVHIVTKTSGNILLQYTGLKDENEKEIYEGDIIVFYENDNDKYEVVCEDGTFCLGINGVSLRDELEDYRLYKGTHHFRVVGNKYENPELLKELS